jgi:exodeoxyribonuclease VIII
VTLAEYPVSSESPEEDALENAEYHRHAAASKSHLDQIARSPLHYWARYLDPNRIEPAPSEQMALGSALHTHVLELDQWDSRYVVMPEGLKRTTKEGKATYEALLQDGRTILNHSTAQQVMTMGRAVLGHPAAAMLLNLPGQAETTHMWIDPSTGLECKCRPDYLTDDGAIVVDVKTTRDASPAGFRKSVGQYRYHVQAAWYLHGLELATGRRPDQFVFVCVESEPPHPVAVYAADSEMIGIGYETAMRDLQRLAECKAAGSWPGYSEDVQIIGLPGWMRPRPDGLPQGEPPEIELY